MAERSSINRFDRERAVIYGGHWARMTQLERGVWVVLITHSDFKTGHVRMTRAKLSKLSGCTNLNRMRDACKRLEQQGILETIDEGGGREKPVLYAMLAPRPFWGSPLFDQAEALCALETLDGGDEETGPLTGPLSPLNGAGQRTETGPVRDWKQGRSAHLNRAGERPPSHISEKFISPPQRQTGPVSGPVSHTRGLSPQEEEVRKFLAEKGLWASSAGKMARLVTLQQAQEIWRGVVADTQVKNRKAALYVRLRELTEQQPGGGDALAAS